MKKGVTRDNRQLPPATCAPYRSHKLLTHYVRKYGDTYLERQHYLHPHPVELMLRNHV